MQINKRTFVNLACYGGLDKQTFKKLEFRMLKRNRRVWTIASILCALLFLAEFVISFFSAGLKEQRYLYLGVGVFFLLGFVLLKFILRKESILERIWIQISILILFAFAILLANGGRDDEYAVTIMVVLLILPVAIDCKPWRLGVMILAAGMAEIITCAFTKTGKAVSMDIYNAAVFTMVSLILNTALLCSRIKALSNESILRRMAYVDPLTGLGNEYSYLEKREIIEKMIQNGEKPEFAVAMFDLNNLKKTNDTYGHAYGCNLVVQCGKYIGSIFDNSQSYHIGGDEYLVIIEKEDLKQITAIFERYDKDMESFYVTKNNITLQMTCARGYAVYNPSKDSSFGDVLEKADKLMYENKKFLKELYEITDGREK